MTIDFSQNADRIFSKVFYKVFNATKRFVVIYGGAGCFNGNQLVVTEKGLKPIKDIQIGDKVLSFHEGKDQYNKVEEVYQYQNNKKVLRVTLKNGNVIEATEDHKFYYGGAWIELKDIVNLWHGRDI